MTVGRSAGHGATLGNAWRERIKPLIPPIVPNFPILQLTSLRRSLL
jgi:hypothetical protein